ncbi:PhzF family phenazine biosynthesis protein [Rhodoferax sp. PAMC 29310]|uniref:PhzF family phenazine biosynthesis protein n=1 Tax=Rhodoferax sp. PAMC 29310 TaxID=2822760 RepID=UPI001B331F68|nr:PhzF family phenazine biosynthesis protein [Rhodoferax sp. PAMC 29310]
MTQRPFKQVDVFTDTPYRGNPLAVVLDGSGLSTEAMQHFTNWTNLSEATFLLPPTPEGEAAGADYRVRIFCPGRELPFAGHPTLGSCHAWLEAGGQPKIEGLIVQECGAGLIRLKRDGVAGKQQLAFAAPALKRSGPLDEADVALIAKGLGVTRSDILHHAWCDNGPGWRAVMLSSAALVLALKPDAAVLAGLDIGVVGAHPAGHDCAFEVRAFFPGNNGLVEDPVTGSLNAALAQWLIGAGLAPSTYLAAQGSALARAGRVHITRQDTDIWVGGASVTCVDGRVTL